MIRDSSPLLRALFLVLGCVCYRLLSGAFPAVVPNISPLIAVALVGAMYLPRAWGWLVGPVAMLLSDAALMVVNQRVDGSMLSWWTGASLAFYVLVGLLGLALMRNKTLLKIAAGSILCSVIFYVVANTFAWWSASSPGTAPFYQPTLAGWWQANTMGLPGWQPTWTFLRNGVLGDLFFCGVLVAILDRALLLNPLQTRPRTVSSIA
jgi:hypothetical protein